jgi:hypothetical protein
MKNFIINTHHLFEKLKEAFNIKKDLKKIKFKDFPNEVWPSAKQGSPRQNEKIGFEMSHF